MTSTNLTPAQMRRITEGHRRQRAVDAVKATTPPPLSVQAGQLAAEATILALTEDTAAACANNAALASRLFRVVARSRSVAREALDMEIDEGRQRALLASMEQLDPDEFRRRVQLRRRFNELLRRRAT